MKKLFFMGLAAAAMLASCSKDETVEMPQSKAISFTNAFVNNGTRSIVDPSFTTSTLQNFRVYGFSNNDKVFDGTEVTNNRGTWNYQPPVYWFKDHVYTFGAIAPSSVTATSATLNGEKVDMSISFTNNGTTDLLHAAPAKVTADEDFLADPQAVALTFNHQLAKVKFSFVNNLGTGYNMTVENVNITNGWASGTLTVGTTNAWSAQAGILPLAFGNVVADGTDTNADAIANGSEAETYNEMLMIPSAADKKYTATFTIKVYDDTTLMDTYEHTVEITGVELKLGYCYDFKATISMDNVDPEQPLKPIEFNPSVSDWAQGGEQTVDVPNANAGN